MVQYLDFSRSVLFGQMVGFVKNILDARHGGGGALVLMGLFSLWLVAALLAKTEEYPSLEIPASRSEPVRQSRGDMPVFKKAA